MQVDHLGDHPEDRPEAHQQDLPADRQEDHREDRWGRPVDHHEDLPAGHLEDRQEAHQEDPQEDHREDLQGHRHRERVLLLEPLPEAAHQAWDHPEDLAEALHHPEPDLLDVSSLPPRLLSFFLTVLS